MRETTSKKPNMIMNPMEPSASMSEPARMVVAIPKRMIAWVD